MHGNGADIIDIETLPGAPPSPISAPAPSTTSPLRSRTGAKQLEVRKALIDTGYQVTPVIDRDYFWAIYFRTPGGVLFEVATNEPGFDRDEDTAHLGEALKLPSQHAHLQGVSGKASAADARGETMASDAIPIYARARFAGRLRCSSSSTAPAATSTSFFALAARAAARRDHRLAARRRARAWCGALLPPHRRGRLRHGRPCRADRARWRGFVRAACRGGGSRVRWWASAIRTAPTSWPRCCSPSPRCSTPRC